MTRPPPAPGPLPPATTLNPETERLYQQHRVAIMRLVHYDLDSNDSIDLLLHISHVLSVEGRSYRVRDVERAVAQQGA